ncbi:alpha-ketoglutarate-dependent dioxygenase AlkB family protein [Gelidibacter maritimus]|uniref:Alpha-ketoglutarate-dependent dioxygenase AlkB n=1 Tax=Gelidibacter maritimus TaxID=2761487 RepID=A0A7W2M2C0_9FLAO|nr:alpha-ketoglutarate-dependent dioxygenase AlkB [Gelidibacter maritimus]MBA6151428.1 alpha-ketoglutarate-dependent dioxygenase AlkB [Gelidibacter maritimus]
MDLFNNLPESNILPFDGDVRYYGSILDSKNASHYFDQLLKNILWEHDQTIIFGKLIVTKRKVAWYGDAPFQYTYSKTTKSALPWTQELLELKQIIEDQSGETFNSCLLNLYHTGDEGMSWHSDDEKDLKKNGAIGSLSLGAARKFAFKHKITKQTVSVVLENGSLLVMKGHTQANWLHRLPPTKKVSTPRLNLTFRTIAT